jgi:hypothetical protein
VRTAEKINPFAAPLLTALFMLCTVAAARATITITLNNKFIDEYANRATMTATVHIDAAAPRPHANNVDGDEHAAGTSDAIGLATVVEIMNANVANEKTGVGDLEGSTGKDVSITGFWRIWPEHGGTDNDFTQGGTIAPIENTNPPHVFEIHPILSIDGTSLQSSLVPIEGYDPKDALDSFQTYDRTSCKITADGNTTTVTTDMVGYNYVRYRLALTSQSTPRTTADGGIEFFAQVEDPDAGDLIANKVRMVAAPGTEIAMRISSMHSGDSLVVWGIPRLDLSLVRYRAAHPNASEWNLPYEMILVAIDQAE